MREPFLFYEEKVSTTPEEKHQKAVRRARKASSASDSSSWDHNQAAQPIRRQDRPSKPDGLTKQTYSGQSPFLSISHSTLPIVRVWRSPL